MLPPGRPRRQPSLLSIFCILSLALLSLCSHQNHHHHHHQHLHRALAGSRQHVSQPQVARADTSPPAGFAIAAAVDDDPYTCGPGKPCSNGACCGASGNCGYGPVYCGSGCSSNCDATAECGQFAKVPGTTCPLNTCCSQHGFCGSTVDFCGTGCQSNCVLEPKPPGGSPKGASMDKVIGYYESWSYRSKCNQKSPTDLPLKELTHLNYAFAFVDPTTYELTTMDKETTEDLWQLTVDTKKHNVNLKVYVAVGGWTFSDNGTATQPLLGEISRSETNRKKFAAGVVRFLNKYGFDGLDIDWEYPGAPDRGGKPDDTANFVLLMKSLREAFDASPRMLGLTFTIPSSFWYLRWFDMPGLLKYADWTNLMSYDLHGSWDSSNPIGSIAQAHTNLTEIDLATQLLWRVGVKPEQVVIGYGFYGRSFELADPKCTKPGCAFKGGAKEGPCSKTSGVLMYYEIQAILKQLPNLKPVFDKEAAIKYLVFDKDQWVSYDDAETFKIKKAWADKKGIGGSMIWAVDTDDDKFSAMSGLVGHSVSHVDTKSIVALKQTSANVASSLQGENGQGCVALTNLDCRPAAQLSCGRGETMIGWDRNGCKSDKEGVPICCPGDKAPKKCTWRGSGNDGGIWGDCNGQCHSGESRVATSKWGGGPEKDRESDPYVCARGRKVFCCEAGDYKNVVSGCRWTPCLGPNDCDPNTEVEVASKKGACPMSAVPKYCCPRQTALHDCRWRGSAPECTDANCLLKDGDKDVNEVQVDRQSGGDSWNHCSWGREKALCCQVSKPLPKPLTCPLTTCDYDPSQCLDDASRPLDNPTPVQGGGGGHDELRVLEERGGGRDFFWITKTFQRLRMRSLRYVERPRLWQLSQQEPRPSGAPDRWYGRHSQRCENTQLESREIEEGSDHTMPTDIQVEHAVPLVTHPRFAAVAHWGRHWAPLSPQAQRWPQSTAMTRTPAMSEAFWRDVWNAADALPAGLPRVTDDSADLRRPADRFWEALGANQHIGPFTFLEAVFNGHKGRLEIFVRPQSPERLRSLLNDAVRGDNMTAVNAMLAPLRETRGLFQYLRDSTVMTIMDNTASSIRNQLQIIERNRVDAAGLTAHWDEFYQHYYAQVSMFARDWAAEHINTIRTRYNENPLATDHDEVLKVLKDIEGDVKNWKYGFED